MGDERDRILKLLEDGKISADQAARLIEALGSRLPEPPPMPPIPPLPMGRHWRRHMTRDFDRIPDLVAKAVSAAVKAETLAGEREEESTDFAGKRNLFVETVSGDVDVRGWDEQRISVQHGGRTAHAKGNGESVNVTSVSNDLSAEMPSAGRLELETVSGDVTVENISGGTEVETVSGDAELSQVAGSIAVQTVSGDIELSRATGELNLATKSGDIDIDACGALSGTVRTSSGDVTLLLPRDADLMLELVSEEGGDIDVALESPHETLEGPKGGTRVKLGAGTRTLTVRTENADIKVRDAEEQE